MSKNELTEATLKGYTVDGGYSSLEFEVKDPFDPTQMTERSMRLWTTDYRTQEESPRQIAQTQDLLRKATGNDALIFDGKDTSDDPNHIANWAKDNVGAPLSEIYATGRGYQIGLPREAGGTSEQFGDSKFLTKVDDPSNFVYGEHFVSVEHAMGPEKLNAIHSKDRSVDGVYQTRAGVWKYSNDDDIIVDVILSGANAYQQHHEEKSLLEFIDLLLEEYPEKETPGVLSRTELQDFRDKAALKDPDYGYHAFIQLIGGIGGHNMPRTIATYAKTLLTETTRTTMHLYVMNKNTGLVYRTSGKSFVAKDKVIVGQWYPAFMEFMDPDSLVRSDIKLFLEELNLADFDVRAQDIYDKLYDGEPSNILNPDYDKYSTLTENLLAFLREIFVGRTISTGMGIPSNLDINLGNYPQRYGEIDLEKLDARIAQFHSDDAVSPTPDVASQVDAQLEDLPEKEAPAAPEAEVEPEAKPADPAPTEAPKTESNDPFAPAEDDAEDNADNNPFLF